ncbi:MAG: mobile mystery protein B [Bdellovibrionales bacterium]|nr:mobile mystery protein B [Bdellovibrionales bacterium]
MSTFKPIYPPGATPLDPNEIEGLIPDYITTQGELNILEQQNIIEGINWADRQKKPDMLNITFSYELHKRMFNQVWKWAGKPRTTDKNIGVYWQQIPTQLNHLFENARYWIENKTYKWDELAARFHHKLVSIHAFPNGNGRHARLMTDILLKSNNQEPFTWGEKMYSSPIEVEGKTRKAYISALKEADKNNFIDLIKFAKS